MYFVRNKHDNLLSFNLSFHMRANFEADEYDFEVRIMGRLSKN